MKVYVLMHDDRSYDMGDTFLRGVYATREVAVLKCSVCATILVVEVSDPIEYALLRGPCPVLTSSAGAALHLGGKTR